MRAATCLLTLGLASAGAWADAADCPCRGTQVEIQAQAGDMQMWTLDGGSRAFSVQLTGPDDELLRHWPATHSGVQDIGWIAPRAGRYRLRAAEPWFGDPHAVPTWRLQAAGPARAAPGQEGAAPAIRSPILLRLNELLAQATTAQKADFVHKFWADAKARGAPLLEALPQRPREVLVTFLWRAPPGTAQQPHRVLLEWGVRSDTAPALHRVPGTDIWQLSLVLPSGLRMAYQLVVDPVAWPGESAPTRLQRMQAQLLSARLDALNPHAWHAGSPDLPADGEAARHAWRSVLEVPEEGPLRNVAAESKSDPEPPLLGTLRHLRYGGERSLSLYLPPGPHADGGLPLLLLFDREAYLQRVRLPQQLDRWIAEGRLPPLAAVLVANPTREARAQELPPATSAFGRMLATELPPWLRAQQPALGRAAHQVVLAGSSYGGLAAGTLAWTWPEVFGNALSLSGSYWWAPAQAPAAPPWAEGGWFMRQLAEAPARPVRFHLAYGLLERGAGGEAGIVDDNRQLRNVLQARGYAVSTHEYAGGHDYYAWGGELLQGLQTLLGAPLSAAPLRAR